MFSIAVQVDLLPSGVVRLDNWINLRMPPAQAALVCALRPAVEDLVTRAADDPESVCRPEEETPESDRALFGLLRQLVRVDAPRHGMDLVSTVSAAQVFGGGGGGGEGFAGARRPFPGGAGSGPSPAKRGMFGGGGRGRGGFYS